MPINLFSFYVNVMLNLQHFYGSIDAGMFNNDASLLKITLISKCGQRGQVILFIVNLMKEIFTSQLRPATRIKVYHKIFQLNMRPLGPGNRVMSHFVNATCGKRTIWWLDIDNMKFVSQSIYCGWERRVITQTSGVELFSQSWLSRKA